MEAELRAELQVAVGELAVQQELTNQALKLVAALGVALPRDSGAGEQAGEVAEQVAEQVAVDEVLQRVRAAAGGVALGGDKMAEAERAAVAFARASARVAAAAPRGGVEAPHITLSGSECNGADAPAGGTGDGTGGSMGGSMAQVMGMPELLQAMAAQLDQGDVLAFALSSRACLAAVRGAGRQIRSPVEASMMSSPARARWLLPRAEKGLDFEDCRVCECASRSGSLSVLQLARRRGFAWSWRTLLAAARGGHLEVIAWADTQGLAIESLDPNRVVGVMAAAAQGGALPVVRWVLERFLAGGWPCERVLTAELTSSAAEGGHIALLEWLHEQGCPMSHRLYARAAKNGQLGAMKWARSHGLEFTYNPRDDPAEDLAGLRVGLCASAASVGRVDIIEWALGEGCPFNWHTYRRAAENGNLPVMEFALAQGLVWETAQELADWEGDPLLAGTCLSAGRAGHLDVVRWAASHGCPWGRFSLHVAIRSAPVATTLEDLLAVGCPLDERSCEVAAVHGRVDVLRWLRRRDPPCPWGNTLAMARQAGQGEVVEWARHQGCPDEYL